MCAGILGWRKRWGGVCLEDWRSREQRALTPGPGAEKSGLPRGKGWDNSHRLSPCHICSPGLPSGSTHSVFVFTLQVSKPPPLRAVGVGRGSVLCLSVASRPWGQGLLVLLCGTLRGGLLAPAQPRLTVTPSPHELCSH